MTERNPQKLNHLENDHPEGLIVDAGWLEKCGYASNLRSDYVSHGWLEQTARGRTAKNEAGSAGSRSSCCCKPFWTIPLIVGGGTALALHGFSHYLSQDLGEIHLYG